MYGTHRGHYPSPFTTGHDEAAALYGCELLPLGRGGNLFVEEGRRFPDDGLLRGRLSGNGRADGHGGFGQRASGYGL